MKKNIVWYAGVECSGGEKQRPELTGFFVCGVAKQILGSAGMFDKGIIRNVLLHGSQE